MSSQTATSAAIPLEAPPTTGPMRVLPFALAIFVGAFLLFQVQPLIGKYILPWFGGTPAVWTTCMLFFQVLLLAGYAYAHASTQFLSPRMQAIVHVALLVAAMALLPIAPRESLKPTAQGDPTWQIIVLLAVSIGVPYFVLSATSPLLQGWFSGVNPGRSPYRLYALSNVGSLLALIGYPFLIERIWTRPTQAMLWGWGLALFAAVCALCAWVVGRSQQAADDGPHPNPLPQAGEGAGEPHPGPVPKGEGAGEPQPNPLPQAGERDYAPMGVWSASLWILLPACASSLLLATTNKLCQDVAVIPFLWVLPLSLYLLTFIICFDHSRWYNRILFVPLMLAAVYAAYVAYTGRYELDIHRQIPLHVGAMFVLCMVCHGEVYRLRPRPQHLTAFYLCISIGGAAGGVFVAVIAPSIFSTFLEYQLSILACLAVAVAAMVCDPRALLRGRAGMRWATLIAIVVPMVFAFGYGLRLADRKLEDHLVKPLGSFRNFYGVLTLYLDQSESPDKSYLKLDHGGIRHGIQYVDPAKKKWRTSYYGASSGIGLLLDNFRTNRGRTIGVVGLGTGSLAVYGRPGDRIVFYEINPLVKEIAQERFTYLKDCDGEASVVMGDARLSLEQEKPREFDVLALDAFSGDAIPVHLITREAFDIYLRHLKADGVIAVHTTNRHLRLRPIVEKLARHFRLQTAFISDSGDDPGCNVSSWLLVTANPSVLRIGAIEDVASPPQDTSMTRLWTDDDTNLFEILRRQSKD